MPTFVFCSKTRAISGCCTLTLSARHRVLAADASEIVYLANKSRFPGNVDVLLTSGLTITISGISDGARVAAEEIATSSLSEHLVDYLQTNASHLGLNSVSNTFIDEDGLPKLILVSSRQPPAKPQIPRARVVLVALDLCYSWQMSDSRSQPARSTKASHPFAKRLSLPFRTILDNVVERFVTWQLVKRYPLIFGPWCQQLDIEASYFPVISSSLFRIMERSTNTAFASRCERLIKILRYQHMDTFSNTLSSLSTYITSVCKTMPSTPENSRSELADEDVVPLALEQVYRSGLLQPQFKGRAYGRHTDYPDDDDLSQEHFLTSAESASHCDEDILWNDASEIFSPGSPLVLVPPFKPSPSCSSCPIDIESEALRRFLENDDWSDSDGFGQEYSNRHEEDHSQFSRSVPHVSGLNLEYTTMSTPHHFNYVHSPQPTGNIDVEYITKPGNDCPCHADHTTPQPDGNPLYVFNRKLGTRLGYQAATPVTFFSPTISGSTPRQEENSASRRPQTSDVLNPERPMITTPDTYILSINEDNAYLDDDTAQLAVWHDPFEHDIEHDILSDTDSNLSTLPELENGDSEPLHGLSVALVQQNSHLDPALPVTRPLDGGQLRQRERTRCNVEVENRDEVGFFLLDF